MYLYLFVSSPLYAITACTSIKKNIMQKIFGNNFLRLLQKLKSLHSQRGLFCHPSSSKNVHTHDSGYIVVVTQKLFVYIIAIITISGMNGRSLFPK